MNAQLRLFTQYTFQIRIFNSQQMCKTIFYVDRIAKLFLELLNKVFKAPCKMRRKWKRTETSSLSDDN